MEGSEVEKFLIRVKLYFGLRPLIVKSQVPMSCLSDTVSVCRGPTGTAIRSEGTWTFTSVDPLLPPARSPKGGQKQA